MQVILDMVISLNGMVAREDGQEDWLPFEGWTDFIEESKKYDNIIMGRETYDKVTEFYQDHNFDDVPVSEKIIVTRSADFKAPVGYTIVHSPHEAVSYLEAKGFKSLYLIGGGVLNAEFIKHALVTDIHLTVTPYILGKGRPFLAQSDIEARLTLKDSKILSNGRIRLLYSVNEQGE